jgi:hypothetical protein
MNLNARSRSGLPLAAAALAFWVCGAAPALAGGSADAGSVQSSLDSVCGNLANLFNPAQNAQMPCPQLPTVSQGVLEIAALLNARPEAIRALQGVSGAAVYASNPVATAPIDLSQLTPLAFEGALTSRGGATPTQLYNPKANSYFYAATALDPNTGQPGILNIYYDYLLRSVPVFVKGQTVAKISLPLAVLDMNGNETAVCGAQGCPASVATLILDATCTGGASCLRALVKGDFAGTGTSASYNAKDLGINIAATFGKSPISSLPHATFSVQVPLLITALNDPAYFGFNFVSGLSPFSSDQTGAAAPVLGAGVSVGIPPYAAPLCANPAGAACPTPTPVSTYGFCASFSNNFTGPIGKPAPAVAAFVQIGTDGEALASTPLPPGSGLPQCPF